MSVKFAIILNIYLCFYVYNNNKRHIPTKSSKVEIVHVRFSNRNLNVSMKILKKIVFFQVPLINT